MKTTWRVLGVLLFVYMMITGFVFGQVPQLINYQGVLINPATGQPVPDGTYSITFSIYDVASGGSAIWTETQSVTAKDGLYNVLLGTTNPLIPKTLSGPEKYLGIKVGGDDEMTPRKRIVSVAYAIVSATADSLGGKAATEYATMIELSTSDSDPPNQGSNQVSWDNLKDMPDGFADGVDNTSGGGGNTLDQAYDQGGPGAGRTIIADAGPVNIEGPYGLRVNGWAGIGTQAPEHQLHVKGFFKLEGTDFLMADPSVGDGGRAMVHWGSGTGTDDRLVLNFAGDFEEGVNVQGSKFIVDGQVGIGNAAPMWKLEVSDDYAANINPVINIKRTGAGSASPLRFTGPSGDFYNIGITQNSEFAISNLNQNIGMPADLFTMNSGKVGINGTQVLYLPNQTNFEGTLYLGDGGGSLSHSFGSDGMYNTGVGIDALDANTTGNYNTGSGNKALYSNTTGIANTANGYRALYNNTTGSYNTAFGCNAAWHNSTGSFNTAIGQESLSNNTTGSYNTALGFGTIVSMGNLTNATVIGNGAQVNASNKVVIGNTTVTVIGGYANWSNLSDGRFKREVAENIKGLDFITRFRPVSYKLDIEALNAHLGAKTESELEYVSTSNKADIVYSGFIGQEVEAAARAVGYDFSGVMPPQNDKDHYSLRYAEFVVPLVKAVQEQQKMIEDLKNEVAELKKRLGE